MKYLYFLFLISCTATAQIVTTFAGFTGAGYEDGPLATAKFSSPNHMVKAPDGSFYVADKSNSRIRKIDSNGVVTTVAGSVQGSADGMGVNARFNYPRGICMDSQGNLFITDSDNHRIRKIAPDGMVTTFAGSTSGFTDGSGIVAKFRSPMYICIDAFDNLYVTDQGNHKIRKITPAGLVSTFAGTTAGSADGFGFQAQFNSPEGICIDAAQNLYIVDTYNHRIRKITPLGLVSTVAGSTWGYADGSAETAKFLYPTGIAIDSNGNLFVSDEYDRIRKIDTQGVVSTFAGSGVAADVDGVGTAASFTIPRGVFVDENDVIYVCQQNNGKIRKITQILSAPTFEDNRLVVYPNPSDNYLNLNATISIEKIVFYDVLGKEVFVLKNITQDTFAVHHNLNRGVYMLQITFTDGNMVTKKISVK